MGALKPQEVTRYYRWLLDREPEPEILAHYQSVGIRRPQLLSMIVASSEFAERMRRMSAPNPHPAAPPEPEPDLRTSEFWQRYVPFMNLDSVAPFREIAFQAYHVPGSGRDGVTKSMLSSLELALLFALAKDHWTGEGEIVDLGCCYGLTTRCLADGLMRNTRVAEAHKEKRVYAYDLFLTDEYDWWAKKSPTLHAGSWFSEFLSINHDRMNAIVPCPGDLLRMNWRDKPVEILMVDAAKSWELNDWIVMHFFPCLIPGKSVVIQQDQAHFVEYWVSITMEYFSDHFEYIDTIYSASAYYLCKSPISPEEARVDLKALPFEEKERLMLAAIRKARPSLKPVLQGAYAKLLIDHDRLEQARIVIDGMDVTILSEEPAYDFSNIARQDRSDLLTLLREESA